MGNFYSSLVVRGAGRDEVVEMMGDRRAFVARMGGCVVVFDEASERQDPRVLAALGSALSRGRGRSVLGVLNHDDDILVVQLHRDGDLVVDYDSAPGFLDGQERRPSSGGAGALCESFGAAGAVDRVAAILASDEDVFPFAIDRHRRLYEALGLPAGAVGYGFSDVRAGAVPSGLDPTDLVDVGA